MRLTSATRPASGSEARGIPRAKWVLAAALGAIAVAGIVLLWPVIFAPVTADDRYWYIEVPAQSDGSFLEAIRMSLREIPHWLELGRVAPLAFIARRVMLLGTFEFSVATTTPLFIAQGLVKLFLLVLGLSLCLAFVRSLRWRADDRLIRVPGRSLLVLGVALTAMVAVGAQAHTQFRNGWISYPILTYGAISVVFGSGALVAWSARRVAELRRGAISVGIVSMVALGVILNTSYELYYVGFPLALTVLMVFPYSTHRGDPNARRARWLIGGVLTFTFIAVFIAIRQLIAAQCDTDECYVGTELSLGRGVLRTLWNNFFTSIPGLSNARFIADLEELGSSTQWPSSSNVAVVVIAVLLVGAVLTVWRLLSVDREAAAGEQIAESRLLMAISVSALGVAVGAALIMSVSVQAQEVITSVGFPYRHTVLTWTACALAVVTLAMAVGRGSSSRVSRTVPLVLVGLLVFAVWFSLPRNLVSHQVYSTLPANRAIADIHWEVVAGDRSGLGDERRCQSLERAEESINSPWLKGRLEPAVDEIFRRMNNMPYCSTWSQF